jgi:hypothetical protein
MAGKAPGGPQDGLNVPRRQADCSVRLRPSQSQPDARRAVLDTAAPNRRVCPPTPGPSPDFSPLLLRRQGDGSRSRTAR